MPKHTSKRFLIKRAAFETCGFRSLTLAHGEIQFPDGRNCRFNVRLAANAGTNGDVYLLAEDINKDTSFTKNIKLRRSL